MEMPRKISAGHGSGRLVSLPPGPLVSAPEPSVDRCQALAYASCDAAINAVAVKLPELWTGRVRGWFAQAEAKFVTKGISATLT